MRRKKTKLGTEIERTYGMPEKKDLPLWLIVGHRAGIEIFQASPNREKLNSVEIFSWPEGKMKGRQLVTDHPGRTFDSWSRARGGHQTGGPRHAFSDEDDPKEHSLQELAKKVALWLKVKRGEDRFGGLILVAEPQVLGHLNRAMDKLTARRVLGRHEKDYAWLSKTQLTRRLNQLVPRTTGKANRLVPPPLGAYRVSA